MARIGTRHYKGAICEETQEPPQLISATPRARYLRDFTTSDLASELLRRQRIKWMHVSRVLDQQELSSYELEARGHVIRSMKQSMVCELASHLLGEGVFQERQERTAAVDGLQVTLSLPVFIRRDDTSVK